ncbi:glycine zipper 2TM domain-containing protein [Sulfurifustis variabilis]|uniref:glycine zipper 2TM domain-containing protein n=1 Tax=Sulfurifustis variabilis TaxID=1675686 RepID=UPI0011E4D6AC|nr:glycine zipper 2TM domain-containing protein [Sulfurifustis variabilis]
MKIAAGAVVVLSAVGVGVMTGLIPGVSSQDNPPPAVQAAAQTPTTTSEPKPVAREPVRVAAAKPAARATKTAAPACGNCGVIESVNAVEVQGQATGAGAVAGAIGGLIVGNQIGSGRGKTLAKVAGAAGGAYAGHQIEKNVRKTVEYQVVVRRDDGTMQTIVQPGNDGLSAGARVRIVDGVVVRD